MFEISELKAPPFACEFKPHPNLKDGEGLQLKLNLDFLTIERIDALNKEIENRVKSFLPSPDVDAKPDALAKKSKKNPATETALVAPARPQGLDSMYFLDKEHIRLRAIMLGGAPGNTDPEQRLIHSWDAVRGGSPVPVCFEVFAGMSKHMQQALYDFVTVEAQKPSKKKSPQFESI